MKPDSGQTYVAFMDIAGFRDQRRGRKKSILKTFYQTVYDQTASANNDWSGNSDFVNSIALSDSALFFVRRQKKKEMELKIPSQN